MLAPFSVLLRSKIKTRERLESVWENRWCGIGLTAIAATVAAYLLRSLPSPGVSVAFMGVVAALMAARTRASGVEKAVWMLIITSLLVVEVLAIRKDRLEHDLAQRELLREETLARKEAESNFGSIGEGIKGAVRQSDEHFQATMGRVQRQVSLAEENLNQITGGDTYAIVLPVVIPINGINEMRLNLMVIGRNPLWDVSITLQNQPIPKSTDFTEMLRTNNSPSMTPIFRSPSISPTHALVLDTTISPSVTGISHYQIAIYARNGVFEEQLHVMNIGLQEQLGKIAVSPWETKYELTKNGKLYKKVPWTTTEIMGRVRPLKRSTF